MRTHLTAVITAPVVSVALIAALVCLWAVSVAAEWPHDPLENLPICTEANYDFYPAICSDGSGGAFMAWQNYRDGGNGDIYAQHVDSEGNLLWTTDGIAVCMASNGQYDLQLISDEDGGVIIVWEDERDADYDIFAQRLDTDGNEQWASDGVPICSAISGQYCPQLAGDGTGGAIIVWQDYRSGTLHTFAQRVNSNGNRIWTVNGVRVCSNPARQDETQIISDDAGGAIVVWVDERVDEDIYAQRLDADGNILWSSGGVEVCTETSNQCQLEIVKDDEGGAIVTWADYRDGSDFHIYAQRLDADGATLWDSGGNEICMDAGGGQSQPEIASDGESGAIITWSDYRGGNEDIYAQRVSYLGTALWETDGVAVCTETDYQRYPQLVGDDAGGAIITWDDYRGDSSDIYAQRLNDDGDVLWTAGGIPVSMAASGQDDCLIASDGSGGAIIVWEDERNSWKGDVYAQLIDGNGALGHPAPVITSAIDHPDDQGGIIILNWEASYLDEWPSGDIDYYSVWRRYGGTGAREVCNEVFSDAVGPMGVDDLGRYGWIHVEDVTCGPFDEYACLVTSFGDSTASGVIYTDLVVFAYDEDNEFYWLSEVTASYSLDNLAPGAPLTLLAEAPSIDVELTWSPSGYHDEDLSVYNVYRGAVSGFTPDETTLIGTAADTLYTDAASGASTWYYRVSAVDVHDNEGDPSNEASVSTTGVADDPSIPGAFALRGNFPNPFNPTTRITFDLPDAAEVRLDIYSASGRRMATLVEGVMVPGRHDVLWRGLGAGGRTVPSGVYFARLEAGGETANHKMILLK